MKDQIDCFSRMQHVNKKFDTVQHLLYSRFKIFQSTKHKTGVCVICRTAASVTPLGQWSASNAMEVDMM